MIPNSVQNRIITRGCITVVAAIAPFSVVFSLYMGIYQRDVLLENQFLCALFVWCVGESLFLIWSSITYSRALVFDRVIPTYEQRQKLKADFLQIIQLSPDGGKEFIEGWFKTSKKKAHIEDLRVDNIKDWVCWAYFASTTDEVVQNRELREEMEETMGILFGALKGFIPNGQIPEGRNPDVECLRLTLDPIQSEHRPLAFYLVVYLLQCATSLLFRSHGYKYYPNNGFGYWYHEPVSPASPLPPLVLIHGIGSILSLFSFVVNLAVRAPNRHIIVLDMKHISMRLPRPTHFPTPSETTSHIITILDRHIPPTSKEPTKAIFFGHSLGSAVTVWILKFAPERVAGLVLCDPISLLLQHSDVAYNFIYRPSQAAAEIFFQWIAREQGIALSLGRNFHWFDNVFPMITHPEGSGGVRFFPKELDVLVFCSERDCIVPTKLIREFLEMGTGSGEVVVMPGLDHGGFLFQEKWMDTVVKSLVELGNGKKGYRGVNGGILH